MNKKLFILLAAILSSGSMFAQKTWTLSECIEYALANNISLQKARANVETSKISVSENKNQLLPNVSASVQQGLNWRPLTESASNFVNNGITSSSSNHATYSGSYGVNASWTAWNGGRNKMNIQNAELNQTIAELAVDQSSNNIAEQITQLYVQILYMEEAVKVNEQLLEHDKTVYSRGKDMVEHGQMSRSDLAQLEAQVASGEYDVVNTKTQIAQAKLSLKQLLELAPEDDVEVVANEITDEKAMSLIPDKMDVYDFALANRPEIKSSEKAIEQSQLNTKIAKAQRLPSVSVGAGFSDSHMSGGNSFGTQLKNNLAGALSAGLSIPIFDQRQSKTAVQRAQVQELSARLDLQDAQKSLYQSIEQYWLNATNYQQKYISSKVNVKSSQTNYDLVEDQFKCGLKTNVDLSQARNNLLSAKQSNLQDKYSTVLNMLLLDFYNGKTLSL